MSQYRAAYPAVLLSYFWRPADWGYVVLILCIFKAAHTQAQPSKFYFSCRCCCVVSTVSAKLLFLYYFEVLFSPFQSCSVLFSPALSCSVPAQLCSLSDLVSLPTTWDLTMIQHCAWKCSRNNEALILKIFQKLNDVRPSNLFFPNFHIVELRRQKNENRSTVLRFLLQN